MLNNTLIYLSFFQFISFFYFFIFNPVTGEVFNNLTSVVFTTLNIIFKQIRLGSAINAKDITFFFKYKVKVILNLTY